MRTPHTPTMVSSAGAREIPNPRRYPAMISYSRLKEWEIITIISRM